MKKALALLLCMLMLTALFSGCTNDKTSTPSNEDTTGEKAQTGPDGRTVADEQIVYSLYSSEVTTFNYLYTTSENDEFCGANGTMTLYSSDCYGVLRPDAATSYEVSDDGLTYTFHIREGQKWYDYQGNEKADVTANDWVSAIRYVCDAANDSSATYFAFTIKNAQAYYDQTSAILNGTAPATNLTPEDIGISATDNYTLVIELQNACPYFLSSVESNCYYPVSQACLDEFGDTFATDNTKMWFCGSYILSDFAPQETRIYTKNENYWNAENVFITELNQKYNAEASALATTMYLNGELTSTDINSDLLDEWMNDPQKSQMVSTTRQRTNYSYFWGFNFEPQVTDTDHNDEINAKWSIAVNSEAFRQSIFHGLDRVRALSVEYPYTAKDMVINTYVPKNFVSYNGKDYTSYGDLGAITETDNFDSQAALQYKEAAIAELTPLLQTAGYSFPIEIVMQYNGGSDWGKECMVVKQQLEDLLGSDYITITILNFGSSGFLNGTRRCGNYCMQKLNQGADYMDPETWYVSFKDGNNYNFLYDTTEKFGVNTKTEETMNIFNSFDAMVQDAKKITTDIDARYAAFANAEAYYINHAIIIPYRCTGGTYESSLLNCFEAPYSSCGWSYLRYVGQKVYTTAMSQDMFDSQLAVWQQEKAAAEKEAAK
ncbi:MAG: ABC transporter substrate-binding protein [Clostridiaceae bacterium]|nr:ABC transporter substrate-binding protein [Clostridiaceae bacterium]